MTIIEMIYFLSYTFDIAHYLKPFQHRCDFLYYRTSRSLYICSTLRSHQLSLCANPGIAILLLNVDFCSCIGNLCAHCLISEITSSGSFLVHMHVFFGRNLTNHDSRETVIPASGSYDPYTTSQYFQKFQTPRCCSSIYNPSAFRL